MSAPAGGTHYRRIVAAAAALAALGAVYWSARSHRASRTEASAAAAFVGSETCGECHADTYEKWKGSHHALAMLPARPDNVRGDFNDAIFKDNGKTWHFSTKDGKYFVRTDDLAGPERDFEIVHTFGWSPLQQYTVSFPGGRLQCLSVAWDVTKRRWFSLYPGQNVAPTDWLHWTRAALNWNSMCSQCHSTGVRKGYDAEADTYDTTWKEISVGCEECHGPGSRHLEWVKSTESQRASVPNAALTVKTSSMPQRDLVNLCAPCHSRRAELKDMERPAAEPLDAHLPVLLVPGLFHADGQILDEVYEVHSFLQSKMFEKSVKCSDCHDVHSGKRHAEGNALCVRCHVAATYDTPAHHFHETIVRGAPSEGAACVSCHMPGRYYMVVHFRRDHSMRVPRPDLSQSLGTPNACSQASCHADKPLSWVIASYDRWYGAERDAHFGTVLAAARDGRPEARAGLLELASDRTRPAMVRATALDLLWKYPGPDSAAILEESISDVDPLVRRTALNRLPIGEPAHFAGVVSSRLDDSVLGVRIEAASRLTEVPSGTLDESRKEPFREALAELTSSLAFSADMPSGRHNLALLESALGRTDSAEKQYRKALELDDQFFMAAVNLAVLLSGQGRNQEAEELLERAVRANPENAAAAFNLGLLLAEMGKAEKAEAALRQAFDADPTLAPAAYNLAVLVGARDPEQAAELCAKAATLRPDEAKYAEARAYYERQLR